MVDQDEFEAWLAEPITRLFIQGLKNYAKETREQFNDNSWAGRYVSPEDQAWLAHLKGRTQTAEWFADIDFDSLKSLFIEEE